MTDLARDLRGCKNKDVRDEAIRMVRTLGFEYVGINGSGHLAFAYGGREDRVEMSCSPRDRHWRRSHRRRVAQYLGLSGRELRQRLGLAVQSGRPSSRRSRKRRTSTVVRKALSVPAAHAVDEVEVAPSPVLNFSPEDPITVERQRLWADRAAERDRADAVARTGPLFGRRAA